MSHLKLSGFGRPPITPEERAAWPISGWEVCFKPFDPIEAHGSDRVDAIELQTNTDRTKDGNFFGYNAAEYARFRVAKRAEAIEWLVAHECDRETATRIVDRCINERRNSINIDAGEETIGESLPGGTDLGDPSVPSPIPDVATVENSRIFDPENRKRLIRVRSTGFTALDSDSPEFPFVSVLEKHASIVSEVDALVESGVGYVASAATDSFREVEYEVDGSARYAYILNWTGGDVWGEWIWSTDRRLTAQAAATTIRNARECSKPSFG